MDTGVVLVVSQPTKNIQETKKPNAINFNANDRIAGGIGEVKNALFKIKDSFF